jgi:hypothetical protein
MEVRVYQTGISSTWGIRLVSVLGPLYERAVLYTQSRENENDDSAVEGLPCPQTARVMSPILEIHQLIWNSRLPAFGEIALSCCADLVGGGRLGGGVIGRGAI